jgi:hypothetical protein
LAVAVADVVEALADLPSGPALGAALAAVDPTRVLNNFLPELLAAQSRQSAHEAARMLGVLAEVGRASLGCPVDLGPRPLDMVGSER